MAGPCSVPWAPWVRDQRPRDTRFNQDTAVVLLLWELRDRGWMNVESGLPWNTDMSRATSISSPRKRSISGEHHMGKGRKAVCVTDLDGLRNSPSFCGITPCLCLSVLNENNTSELKTSHTCSRHFLAIIIGLLPTKETGLLF